MIDSPSSAVANVGACDSIDSIKVLREPHEILKLRDFWDACDPGRDADLDFYLSLSGVMSAVKSPLVFVLYRGGQPRALLCSRLEDGISSRSDWAPSKFTLCGSGG